MIVLIRNQNCTGGREAGEQRFREHGGEGGFARGTDTDAITLRTDVECWIALEDEDRDGDLMETLGKSEARDAGTHDQNGELGGV